MWRGQGKRGARRGVRLGSDSMSASPTARASWGKVRRGAEKEGDARVRAWGDGEVAWLGRGETESGSAGRLARLGAVHARTEGKEGGEEDDSWAQRVSEKERGAGVDGCADRRAPPGSERRRGPSVGCCASWAERGSGSKVKKRREGEKGNFSRIV